MVTHFAGYVSVIHPTSWALCGRLVLNARIYEGETAGDEVTCKQCLRCLNRRPTGAREVKP